MFKDKVVVITGSGRGLGAATAKMFAKEGAKIVLNDLPIRKDELKLVEDELKELGTEVITIIADVSKENEVITLFKNTFLRFDRINVLVNNAGIVFDRPFLEQTDAEFTTTIDTNLKGTYFCTKHAAKYLEMQEGSSVVCVSSTNGMDTLYSWSMDYDASKAGIINLMQNLALELAPKIRVNAVSPGWINTPMNSDLPEQVVIEESKRIALKRFAEPEEVSEAILFLASTKARYITGSNLRVDGGLR